MVVPLIASALLLDFFGCMMPLALVEDTKAFKVGVFLIWAALVADSVLMGLFYPRELAGVNPLLAAGLESICLICDIDFDEAERKFAAAARRAAAFREGKPKLMQDEARRAAIRETRHRVCTAPILKSIKEIHR